MKTKQTGFTLAEMAIVIAVLSILSVFIVPRMDSLIVEAKESTVERLGGSLAEAATIAHSVQIADLLAENVSVDMTGNGTASTTMDNRYPTATDAGIVAAITSLSTSDDAIAAAGAACAGNNRFQAVADGTAAPPTITFVPCDMPSNSATCRVVYTEAASVGETPTVDVTVTNCR